MIEIQCTSCHTRYRIDERVLPDDTPTFKCSRCGHVFNADPAAARPNKTSPRQRSGAAPRADGAAGLRQGAIPLSADPEPAGAAVVSEPPTREAPPAEPEPAKPSTAELMNRPFSRESVEPDAGENLSFDFSDEGSLGAPEETADTSVREADDWQVGETPAEFAPRAALAIDGQSEPAADAAAARGTAPPFATRTKPGELRIAQPRFATAAARPARASDAQHAYASDGLPDDVAYVESRGPAHSAGWFIALFFAVAVGFGLASMAICGEPVASARMLSQAPGLGAHFTRPIVPAMLVALHNVRAQYQPIKGGAVALLVSGTAENVGNDPLHEILIAVTLLDGAQRQVGGQTSYCGNGLTEKMVGEMTPREIEFLQRLDPQKNFAVDATHSAQFLMVFINPPRQTAALRISVAKAVASSFAAAPAPTT
ncbi:MAG TPA: zinc-ribbon domain-containing protein [Candidatus Binataceae bacterium]|nr:zinc-ribbon domain-containing protein [Candidatus Binataceae bacterium]